MLNNLSQNKRIMYAIIILIGFAIIYVSQAKEEFCPVIDDLRVVDSVKAVNEFNRAKVAYFVDLQNSYQILVAKSQVDAAYQSLAQIGITARSQSPLACKHVK